MKDNPQSRGGSDSIRALIDTNILILREDDRVITTNLASLMRLLSENNVPQLVHPLSVMEIKSDRDDRRREIMLSKLRAYSMLDSPPNLEGDVSFREALARAEDKLEVDDHLLYAVYMNAVDYLITEDKGLHRRAKRLGVQDRVLTIQEMHALATGKFDIRQVITPSTRYLSTILMRVIQSSIPSGRITGVSAIG